MLSLAFLAEPYTVIWENIHENSILGIHFELLYTTTALYTFLLWILPHMRPERKGQSVRAVFEKMSMAVLSLVVLAAGLCLFFYAAGKLEVILKTLRTMESCIGISPVYLSALLKMAGITYIAEFASGICKDAGYGSLGTQIEIFAKLSILAVSMPILLALLETVKQFLA